MENENRINILQLEELSELVMLDSRRYDNSLRGE